MDKVDQLTNEINALEFNNLWEMEVDGVAAVWERNLPTGLTKELVEANTQYRHDFHTALVRSKISDQIIAEAPKWAESGQTEVTFKTPDVDLIVRGTAIGERSDCTFIAADINAPVHKSTYQACVDKLVGMYGDRERIIDVLEAEQ